MIEVVPSIIPESFDDLYVGMSQVRKIVPRVQLDIANGTYAPSTTWPFSSDEHFAELASEAEGWPFWRDLDIELDMLIAEPEEHLDEWIRTGIIAAIIHIESTREHSKILKNLRMYAVGVGWGVKPSTPNDKLFAIIAAAGAPDFVQVMGSDRIGYHGVELEPRVYAKVREIRERYPELSIAVDIGVSEETAPKLVEAGVTKLVAGSAIFGEEDTRAAVERLRAPI